MTDTNEFEEYKKIIEESGLFDSKFYVREYKDARRAKELPLEHFVKFGLKEDRKPNEWFDPVWYREHYKDLKNEILFIHYIIYGEKEFRFANANEMEKYETLKTTFDANAYKNHYEDLKSLPEDFDYLWHYLHYGMKEGRELTKTSIADNLNDNDEYTLLATSNLWDEAYYLEVYSDVASLGVDPLEHFLLYGFKENKNPSKLFHTEFYLTTNPDVQELGINPLVHYLLYGQKEGRKIFPKKEKSSINLSTLISYLDANKEIPKDITTKPIDIIIPVYNGYEYLAPLFNSIFRNTTTPYRLLVCDDKSPDTNVHKLLKKIQQENENVNFELYKNEENLGFVGTVNRMVQHTKNHFVLLNTDTEVPSYWLERLMYPIFHMEKIATTTPFTNAGTICSFPNYLEDNAIYENLSVDELDDYFKQINFKNTYINIPTGVGFCIGVNKDLVDKIGMFDTIFGKGYGEENDLCQRAIEEGYQNLHVPNLFVYHKHGGSFPSETKKRLIETNYKLLLEKHSTYEEQIQESIQKDSLKDLRLLIEAIIQSHKRDSCLIIDHALGGGANHYTNEKINERLDKQQIIFLMQYDYVETKRYICTLYLKDRTIQLYAVNSTILHEFLTYFNFDEIFINSLVSFSDVEYFIALIQKLHKSNNSKLIIPLHDYFPLCPNYTLLNQNNRYCEIPSSNSTACRECLMQSSGDFKQFSFIPDIQRWRNAWSTLFSIADEVLCFSYASESIFQKTYPKFKTKTNVVYHDISGRYEVIYEDTYKNKKRIIGILGGINVPKGALVIKNMVKYIEGNDLDIKIVLVGEISEPIISDKFYMTGRYSVNELPEMVKQLNITEFFIPSVCPETFSYTTDEIMQLGYPLTVFDIGAPAERVKNYKRGNIINMTELKIFLEGNLIK